MGVNKRLSFLQDMISKRVIAREKGAAFAAENDMMFQEVFTTDKQQVLNQMLGNFVDNISFREGLKSI